MPAPQHRSVSVILRRTAIAAAALFALIAAALGAGGVWLDSKSGKAWLVGAAEDAAAKAGYRLTLAPLQGSLFGHLTIAEAVLADDEGVWLRMQGLQLIWTPAALWRLAIDIEALTLEQVRLLRLPDRRLLQKRDGQEALTLSVPPLPRLPAVPVTIRIAGLSIDHLDLSSMPAGTASDLSVTASGLYGRSTDISVKARVGDAGRDLMALTLDYSQARDRLAIDVLADDPVDGVLPALTGTPGPYRLMLTGDGPLDDWSGRLESRFQRAQFDATLRTVGAALTLSGAIAPGDMLNSGIARLVGRRVGVELIADRREDRVLLDADVRAEAARLSAHLPLQIGRRSDLAGARLTVVGDRAAALNDLLDGAAIEGLRVDASIEKTAGDDTRRQLTTRARIAHAHLDGNSVDGVDIRLSGDVDDQSVALTTTGSVAALMPAALARGNGPPAVPLTWEGAARLQKGFKAVAIERFDLDLDGLHVAASGDLRTDLAAAALRVDLGGSLSTLAERLGQPIKAALDGLLTVERDAAGAPFAIDGELAVTDLETGQAGLDQWLGDRLDLAVMARIDDGGSIELPQLSLRGPSLEAEAAGRLVNADGLDLDYALALVSPDRPAGLPISPDGRLVITGKLGGTLDDPSAALRTRLDALTVEALTFTDLQLEAAVTDINSARAGEVTLGAASDYGPLTLRIPIRRHADGGIALPDLALRWGELTGGGSLTLAPGAPVAGRITLLLAESGARSAFPVDGRLDVAATFGAMEQQQSLRLHGNAERLRARTPMRTGAPAGASTLTTIDKVDIDAMAIFGASGPIIDGMLVGRGIVNSAISLDTLAVEAQSEGARSVIALNGRGVAAGPVALSATTILDRSGPGFNLTTDIGGNLGAYALATTQPIRVETGASGQELHVPGLTIGDGMISLDARTASDAVSFDAAATDLPLDALSVVIPQLLVSGVVDADIAYKNGLGDRRGRASVKAGRLQPLLKPGEDSQPLDLDLDLLLAGNRLELSGTGGRGQALLTASGVLSLKPATAPAALPVPDRTAPLTGALSLTGPVAPFVQLAALRQQTLQGVADITLDLAGTFDAPQITGRGALSGGRYEHTGIGLILGDLGFEAGFDGQRITLASLSANDGADGRLAAQGWLDLPSNGDQIGADIRIDVDAARLVRRRELKAQSSAELRFHSIEDGFVIEGDVGVDRIDLKPVTPRTVAIPTLEVEEINRDRAGDDAIPAQTPQSLARGRPVALDLRIKAPARLYVRGRGLDGEWGADMTVGGTLRQPRIVGSLDLVRGIFDFGGRRFDLEDGSIVFSGGRRVNPDLNISAVSDLGDITARIAITGSADAPRIALSATPSLPEDEILARILFGTSAADLGPLEALQLARAVNGLTSEGGFDVIGTVRRTVGVDRLTINAGGAEGSSVTGGKYLTNNVYVEVTTAVTGETSTRVEVDLTRRLSLASRVGLQRDNNLFLRWSRDY